MYSSLDVIKQQFATELPPRYSDRECLSLFYQIIEYSTGLRKVDVVLNPSKEVTEVQANEINDLLNALKQGAPIQYLVQAAPFMNHAFYVDDSVLIPRPETEELVQWILDTHSEDQLKLLDIGTGSGAIPVSLSSARPNWVVMACDVSNEALVTARRNAREILTQSDVAFYREDILDPKTEYHQSLDIIVSNPPYVLESDKELMEDNVLQFEPGMALFVPDTDPILFYRAISKYALNNLKTGGYLYFEIHELYAEMVQECMVAEGFKEVVIKEDLQDKPRMICGKRA